MIFNITPAHGASPEPPAAEQNIPSRRFSTILVGPLLDYGMRMYRYHFLTFVSIELLWSLPIAALYAYLFFIQQGSLLSRGINLIDPFVLPIIALMGVGAILGVIAIFFGMGFHLVIAVLPGLALLYALSRAAVDGDSGEAPSLRSAWHIRPRRLAGMAILSIIYSVLMGLVLIALACICGLFTVAAGALVDNLGGVASPVVESLMFIFILMLYSSAFLASYSVWAGLCYALQPLIQEEQPVWQAVRAGLTGLSRHFAENIRLFIAAGLTAGGFSVSILASLLALNLTLLITFDAGDNVAISTTLASFFLSTLVTLPPIPIWMAIAYRQRQLADSEAETLAQRIAQLYKSQTQQQGAM